MDYQFKHYRIARGSSIGLLIAEHVIDAADASAAIVSSPQFTQELRPLTDYAILKDGSGALIRGWGLAMEPTAISVR